MELSRLASIRKDITAGVLDAGNFEVCQHLTGKVSACAPDGVSGGTSFALALLRAKDGGEGSRTPVHNAVSETFYMLRRSLISEMSCEPSRHVS